MGSTLDTTLGKFTVLANPSLRKGFTTSEEMLEETKAVILAAV